MFGIVITKENKFVMKINQDHPPCKSHVCFQSLQDMGRKQKLFAAFFPELYLSAAWMKSPDLRDLENNLILQVFLSVGHLRE